MIVDLTGYRGGVYFEAGFGFGLGIPVIYTCHKDWLTSKSDENGNLVREGVHFDLNHRNILFWTDNTEDPEYARYNLEKFKDNLIARINAVVV
jgi:nucleoside 2-deoxyribosyltransferase